MSITSGFSINKEDMLRGKQVKPGVYLLRVTAVEQKPGVKNPDSNTTHISMVIEGGEFEGVSIKNYLSEAAPGLAVPFLEAIMNKKLPDEGIQVTKEMLMGLLGRKVKAAIKPVKDPKFGWKNEVEGWLPA